MMVLTALSALIWAWLLTLRGGFWRAGPVLPPAAPGALPVPAPAMTVVVPARDEAPLIGRALRSLLAQDYPGPLRIILVDDRSADGTGAIAHAIADPRLTVLTGAPRPQGWAGKLWAVQQGVTAADALGQNPPAMGTSPSGTSPSGTSPSGTSSPGTPDYFFLTDADIEHDPRHLSSLMAMAERHDLDMVSEMVALSCDSLAEKALIPAFVYFFQLLYPFAWVNNPLCATAAAAGGTMLLRRRALTRIGGTAAVRGALIDDVALAGAVKTGGRIFLGHSALARSVRPYPDWVSIWRMIARSAYAQLRFSPLLLAAATLGMALVWLVPPAAALFGHGTARVLGPLVWAASAATFVPTLRRFHRSWLWAAFLPLIALFYMAATIGSAVHYHRGLGVVWKGRAYAGGTP